MIKIDVKFKYIVYARFFLFYSWEGGARAPNATPQATTLVYILVLYGKD